MPETADLYPPIPPDDLTRSLVLSRPESDGSLPHIGLVGDTYTITVSGDDTAGRYCVIDMHIPPDGGPGPHRHDFEETFLLLEGEMTATFRGEKTVVKAGETIHIPANAPHQFHNASSDPVRLLCICSPSPGELLSRGWHTGRNANHATAKAGESRSGRVSEEGAGTRAEVPHGVAAAFLKWRWYYATGVRCHRADGGNDEQIVWRDGAGVRRSPRLHGRRA